VRILLIDNRQLFRQGLKLLLADLAPGIDFIEAPHCALALRCPPEPRIDLVLMDLHAWDGGDWETDLAMIRSAFGPTSVVVLPGDDDHRVVTRALAAGAAGYVPMSSSPSVLLAALRLVLAGGMYLPPGVLPGVRDTAATPSAQWLRDMERLSQRQRAVLLKAIQGKANKVIARELNMAEGTVKAHLSAAFRALGVHNRTQAAMAALRLGMRAQPGGVLLN
jgi:DNA-binding NarL/FixJ family response regulator